MALIFRCHICNEHIVVRYLKTGEVTKCKSCGAENVVPRDAIGSDVVYSQKAEKPKADSAIGMDLIKGIALIWLTTLIPPVIYGVYTALSGKKLFTDNADSLIFYPLEALSICFVGWYFVCKKYGKTFFEGFAIKKVSKKIVVISLLIGMLAELISIITEIYFPLGETFMDFIFSIPWEGASTLLLFALFATFHAPIFEEIYYRGFIFPILSRKAGIVLSVIFIGVWFGALHGFQYNWHFVHIFSIVVFGSVLALQRHMTGSLIPSILTHFANNLLATLLALILFFPVISIPFYNFALTLNPDNADYYQARGETYRQARMYEKAIADFKKALKLDPTNSTTMNYLAWIYVSCPDALFRDPEKALQHALKAVTLNKTDYKLHTLACAHAERGDFDEAIKNEQKAYKRNPKKIYKEMIQVFKQKKTYLQYMSEKKRK